DRPSAPSRVWNRIGDDIQQQIVEMALDYSELSPRDVVMWLHEQGECWIRHSRNDALLFPNAAFGSGHAGSGWVPGLPQRIPGTRVLLSGDAHAASFRRRFGNQIVQRAASLV